jgi:hypothetical protein
MTITALAIVIIAASFPVGALLIARHYLGEGKSSDSSK